MVDYSGDPLNDFTLLKFLDQFVHKNPKQGKGDKGGSLMQPTSNLLKNKPYTLPSEELMTPPPPNILCMIEDIYMYLIHDMNIIRALINAVT